MPNETIGDVEHVVTADHPPRTDSPEYVKTRKWLMSQTAGGCYICGGPVDLSHPESPGDPTGIQDHHGGGIFLIPEAGDPVLVGTNLFGLEWSLGWGADPVRVAAFVTQLNAVTSKLGGTPYIAEIATTADVMAWVDSPANANVKLCAVPGARVRMADGSERAIESIRPGDVVVGGDGLPHEVYATASRNYEGLVISPSEGLWLTPDHDVIRPEGWTAVSDLTATDCLYRVEPSRLASLGMPFGVATGETDIKLAVVHDGETERRQLSIAGEVVGDPWPVPMVSGSLNNHPEVGQQRVAYEASEGRLFFPANARFFKGLVEQRFKPGRMTASSTSLSVVVIEPETLSGTVGRGRQTGPEGCTAGSAFDRSVFARRGVQGHESSSVSVASATALIRAEASPLGPSGSHDEGSVTLLTATQHSTAHGAFAPASGSWRPVGKIGRKLYRGIVHDISVRSARSFVASDVVIHNCAVHHIAHEDTHTPDVNGHEGVGIHNGPVPIWLGQATVDWDKWDMWGGSTGTLAVGHPGDDSRTAVVLHVSPLHPDQSLYNQFRDVAKTGRPLILPPHHANARLAYAGAAKDRTSSGE